MKFELWEPLLNHLFNCCSFAIIRLAFSSKLECIQIHSMRKCLRTALWSDIFAFVKNVIFGQFFDRDNFSVATENIDLYKESKTEASVIKLITAIINGI